MLLLGGFKGLSQAAEKAGGGLEKAAAYFDHIWHELKNGDLMTWVAFAFVAVVFIVGIGVWRGSFTWKKGN